MGSGKEPPKEGEEDWTSERGLLQFTDFVFEDQGSDAIREDVVAYRIERDRVTRSVERGKNLMIQTPFLPGGS